LGHIIRNSQLENVVTTGKFDVKKGLERPRTSSLTSWRNGLILQPTRRSSSKQAYCKNIEMAQQSSITR